MFVTERNHLALTLTHSVERFTRIWVKMWRRTAMRSHELNIRIWWSFKCKYNGSWISWHDFSCIQVLLFAISAFAALFQIFKTSFKTSYFLLISQSIFSIPIIQTLPSFYPQWFVKYSQVNALFYWRCYGYLMCWACCIYAANTEMWRSFKSFTEIPNYPP